MARLVFLCTVFLFYFQLCNVNCEASASTLVPALYVFGDSTVDAGNNNYLKTPSKKNFLPYGIDFIDGPTGRSTNGNTVADYLALHLGLPFAPPYLGLMDSRKSNITTGINYGSGSCGILPDIGIHECFSLDKQIELFQNTIENYLLKKDLQKHLSKSIFFISMGENDYILGYYKEDTGLKKKYSPDAFSEFLVNGLSKRLQRLYDLGARKFLVTNIIPIGCLPAAFNRIKPKGDCVDYMNQAVKLYNEKLPMMLQELQTQLAGSVLTCANTSKFLSQVETNPVNYGIVDTRDPCCLDDGNGTLACKPNSIPCERRDKYLFFDVSHTSQAVNEIFASLCFKGSFICTPLNVMDLVLA